MTLSVETPATAPEVTRYLDETVRVWLGISSREAAVPRLPAELARLFLRLEEHERPERDRWGCWDFDSSENSRAGRLREPEVDRWLAARRAELAPETPLEPLWPDTRRFAVCLTHDVDLVSEQATPRQALRFARAGLQPDAGGAHDALARLARPPVRLARALGSGIARAPSTRETLERSVEVETARGVVASYFFTVPPAHDRSRYDCVYAPEDACRFRGRRARVADVMRTIAGEGFDVGLHGSYGGALAPGALAEERARLEAATGLAITTTRQHFLRWDVRTTPLLQEAAGLRADSSLGFNRNVGFRAGTSLPFHAFDVAGARRLDLVEVPLVVEDTALPTVPGLGLDPTEARRIVAELLDTVADVGGALTLLFHPDKLARPDWLSLYEWMLDRALEAGAWVTSLRRLEEWWRGREARVLGG
jgi:hypothetical protein